MSSNEIVSLENSINVYIKHKLPEITSAESDYLTNILCKDVDKNLNSYYNSLKESKEIALELSNYNNIFIFLTRCLSEETLNRVKAIDWKSSCFDETLKEKLGRACVNNNPDEFIGLLNSSLGNCCITSIDELDDV